MNEIIEAIKKLVRQKQIVNIISVPFGEDDDKISAEQYEKKVSIINFQLDSLFKQLEDKVNELQNSLRWIPVTEQLPPDKTDVDFLCVSGYDGYGHVYRQNKEWNEKYNLPHDPTPKMMEYEGGPYNIGKDDFGNWAVTHWRLRPGTQPDFEKFFEDNK